MLVIKQKAETTGEFAASRLEGMVLESFRCSRCISHAGRQASDSLDHAIIHIITLWSVPVPNYTCAYTLIDNNLSM